MATDSRETIQSPRSRDARRCIGFHDFGRKLSASQISTFGLAFAGFFNNDMRSIHPEKATQNLLDKYVLNESSIIELHKKLHLEFKTMTLSSSCSTLIAGYQLQKPFISYIGNNPNGNYPFTKPYGFLCNYVVPENNQDDRFKEMSLENAVLYCERFIDEYANQHDYWKGIGGHKDILCISASGIKWCRQHPEDLDLSIRGATLKYFRAGKLKCFLYEGYTEDDLIDALEKL